MTLTMFMIMGWYMNKHNRPVFIWYLLFSISLVNDISVFHTFIFCGWPLKINDNLWHIFFSALMLLVRPRRAHSRCRVRVPRTFHMGALWPLSLFASVEFNFAMSQHVSPSCPQMGSGVHRLSCDLSQSQSWEVCWQRCSEWPLGSSVQQSCQRQVEKNPKKKPKNWDCFLKKQNRFSSSMLLPVDNAR